MLFQHLAVALAGGLTLRVAAIPAHAVHEVPVPLENTKREIPASHGIHERGLPHWGRSWEAKHRVPRDAKLPMRIGLQQSNLEQGQKTLLDM